ncbi:MAG: hypothetical protein JNK82_11895, partial [Myxococcaceae bacterium]|nr:hypothetical protein [Myxococcaceae bacterium]
ELAQTSPLIVRARIGQLQPAYNKPQRSIATLVEVQVTDVIKGDTSSGSTLMVRTQGGTVGKLTATVAGAALFTPGEDVLLFLEPARDTAGIWLVSSMAAGKVTFVPDAAGNLRAKRDTRGLAFYEHTTTAPAIRRLERIEDLGTPEQLIGRLRKAVTP